MRKIHEFFRTEKEKMKSLTPRQRIVYLWDYYKLTIGALVLAAALLIYTLGYQSGRGKIDMYAVLVNAGEGESTPFVRALEEKHLGGTVSVDVSLSYTNAAELAEEDIATIEVLYALFSMGDMDLFAANPAVFERYTAQDGFENLELLLPQELLRDHTDAVIRYTTETGQEKVGGILLKNGSPLHRAGYYDGPVAVGIAARCEHLDEALAVIEYLLENTGE